MHCTCIFYPVVLELIGVTVQCPSLDYNEGGQSLDSGGNWSVREIYQALAYEMIYFPIFILKGTMKVFDLLIRQMIPFKALKSHV